VNPSKRFTWTEDLKDYVPALVAAKNIILADQTSTVQVNQWLPLLSSASDLYHRVLYYMYFIKPRPITSGDGLNSLDILEKQLLKTLSGFVQAQATATPELPVVPNSALINLLQGASSAGFINSSITAAAVQPMLQSLFGKLLMDPAQRLAGAVSTGLSQDNISRLDLEYQIWSANQHLFLQDTALNSVGQNQADLQKWLSQQTKTEGIAELQLVLAGTPSFVFNSQGRMEFGAHVNLYDFNSLSYTNLARAIGRLLENGYVLDATRLSAGTGLVSTEFQSAYADFQPFAVALQLVSASNTTFATSRFFEAGIFTPLGNGDQYMSMGEATQIIEMIISGLGISSQMSKLIGDNCTKTYVTPGADGPDDALDVNCVAQIYDVNYAQVFPQAPDLVAYLKSVTSAVRQGIVLQYLAAAGADIKGSGTGLRSDISLIPYVFQYAESLMQRYDLKHVGALDYTDAVKAFPNFRSLIAKKSPINSTAVEEGAFFYILTHEKVSTDFITLLPYIWDAWLGNSVNIDVDRSAEAAILAAIVASIGETPATAKKISIPAGSHYPFLQTSP
jgi:hypothetical protein